MSEQKGQQSEADICLGFMGIQRERVFYFQSETNIGIFFFFFFNLESF